MEGGKIKKVLVVVFVVLGLCGRARAVDSNGLISHWAFDEAEGSIAYDSAGDNDGNIYGAEWTTGKIDGALDFDGVDDYVNIGQPESLADMGKGTIVLWFKPGFTINENLDTYVSLFEKNRTGGGYNGDVFLGFSGSSGYEGCLRFDIMNDIGGHFIVYSDSSLWPAGAWQHVAATWDNATGAVRMRVNAVEQIDKTDDFAGITMSVARDVTIGSNSEKTTSWWAGVLDDVRIYNRPLSTEEVEEVYQEGAGPIAHWKFDEGEGSVAYDSAGDNDGTLVNGPLWTTGLLDGALRFDGVDDYVEVNDSATLDITSQITILAWLKRDATGIRHDIVAKTTNVKPYNGFHLVLDGENRAAFALTINNSWEQWGGGNIDSVNWHCLVGTFDGNEMVAYIDGSPVAQRTASGSIAVNDNNLYIGRSEPTSALNFFDGTLDDVRIYGRALPAEEVQHLYEEPGPPPPCVFYVDGVNGSDLNDGLTLETAFATIQKGIDTAQDGNTVLVYPAVYQEEINFDGKAITVQGVVREAEVAVLEAPPPMDFAVSMYLEEGPDSILKHFVIRNSDMALFLAGASPTLSHLIIVDNEFGIGAYAGADPDISNCIFYNNTDGDLFQCEARYSWVEEDVNGPNEPDTPMFADAAGGDYHLLSERGRYWPAMDVWVLDEVTSPCVDGGDPNENPSGEQMPNGGRVNMGVYGGTAYASMSEWPIREDNNQDGIVNMFDLAMLAERWLEKLGWAE